MGRVTPSDRIQIVRDCYAAYETGDRDLIDRHLAGDYVFSAPPDVGIDRATYFERCWPNAANVAGFEFERLFEHDGEVFVTYVATRSDGSRFRNTEVFRFDGDKVVSTEVYFGWNLG